MEDATLWTVTGTAAFRPGVLDALISARLARKIESYSVKPKYVSLLTA